jgi:hypothetical protein
LGIGQEDASIFSGVSGGLPIFVLTLEELWALAILAVLKKQTAASKMSKHFFISFIRVLNYYCIRANVFGANKSPGICFCFFKLFLKRKRAFRLKIKVKYV